MENLESRLKNAPYFRCEKGNDSVPVCQKCETCVLAWKIFSTREWFWRVGAGFQRRFLVSVLQQLDSLHLLHYFLTLLQTMQGKDLVYHRARVDLSRKEGKMIRSSWNPTLDEMVEQKMRGALHWLQDSSQQTKAKYTLLLLQMCDPGLLLTATDVIRVLFLREWGDASGIDPDFTNMFFIPKEGHTHSCDTSQVCWAAGTRHTTFPLSKATGKASLRDLVRGGTATAEVQWKNSLRCISEMNRLFSEKTSVSKSGWAPATDVLLDLDTVRELSSGVSRYRDFIRQLPIHLSKYILSLLDRSTLNRCSFVSQHWAALAQQVKTDLSMHSFIQHQIAFLQGSYTRGIDPNYANKVIIPVPKMTDDGKHLRVKNQKWKLRTKNDYNLWTAYQNQETQQVQMEERNVFCGSYNIRILSDMWDRNRIIHYSGGDLLAMSSNRKIQLLDIICVKEIPIRFRGHAGSVRALFLCEEENFLLSGSYDLSIRYWDLKSGACIRIFNGHQGTITCMDVYKNKLASGAKDCQVKEWDIETGKCLKTFKHKDPILAIRINDTYIVSSCEKGMVKVWHMATAQLVKGGSPRGPSLPPGHQCLCRWQDPHLQFPKRELSEGDESQWQRMVINTESNILLFQFENIKWQYSVERTKQKKKDREEDREDNSFAEVLSKSSTQVYSPRDSVSSKQTAQESLLSKPPRSRIFLRASRLPTGVLMETPPSLGKPKSPWKDGRKRLGSQEANSMGAEQENLEAKPVVARDQKTADDVEKLPKQRYLGISGDLISRSKKSWNIPMSPDQFLLTVNALQKAHNSGEFAYPRRPQAQIIDVWGPSIPFPRKVLSLKGQEVQQAVDRLRFSTPPIEVKQTSIPLKIQKLQPNLKKSVHGPRVQSTIPQPVLICPRFRGGSKATSSTDGVRSFSPLTSTQVIKPNRMLAPPMGPAAQAAKKERPRFYSALDPLRVNTEFMLLTVKEQKEYEEARMKEFQAIKPVGVVDPEKASRASWIRKIKGLPIDNFTKQGKTAAPELGQNVFI
nr:CMT1A duplicated region transcript 1 protein isoform X9 [Odocoileus virginianus texanus]